MCPGKTDNSSFATELTSAAQALLFPQAPAKSEPFTDWRLERTHLYTRAEGILQLDVCLRFNGLENPEQRSSTYEGVDIQEDTSSKASNRICAADF